jgi:hypothetical protein
MRFRCLDWKGKWAGVSILDAVPPLHEEAIDSQRLAAWLLHVCLFESLAVPEEIEQLALERVSVGSRQTHRLALNEPRTS